MSRFSSVIMIAVVFLALALVGQVIKAQVSRAGEKHRLVQVEDVASFGEVKVFTHENAIEKGGVRDYGLITGWDEGKVTDLVVVMPEDKNGILINSASYKFQSVSAAQAALDSLPNPVECCSWQFVAENTSPPQESLAELLKGHSWRLWQGIDGEGLPAYVLWIRFGALISEVHLNVTPGQEALARQVLNHVAAQLVSR
ncbi:MAG: hypothetical protein Q9O62_01640 [Ardenticatenia bacterium]|nr:hypothetical protein [Ardenticatenia bacterium]